MTPPESGRLPKPGLRAGRLDESGPLNIRILSLPPGCVTGIGSLPMKDAREAVRFVEEVSPLLPFWPQLPARSPGENALTQFLGSAAGHLSPRGAGPGLSVKPGQSASVLSKLREGAPDLDPSRASGFFAFEEALIRNSFPDALGLKGQITGPVTLATYLFDGDRPFAASRVLTEALGAHLTRQGAWQVKKLKRFGKPLVVFVDEPGLAAVGPSILAAEAAPLVTALADLFDALRDAGALAGMHCCGTFPLGLLSRAHPDVLSFDALGSIETFLADPDVHAYFRTGGRVAYGLVPTRPDPRLHTAEALFDRWRTAAASFASQFGVERLARSAMITATCGHARVEAASARASFALAHKIKDLFASAAGT